MKTTFVCAFYRVSTDIQDNQRQKQDVQAYCRQKDLTIAKYFENNISGAKRNRKEVQEMFNYLDSTDLIEAIVISELSRLGRTNEVLQIIDKLTDRKICLISLKENLQTLDENKKPNPTAALIINVLAGINNFELSTIKYRVASGKKASIAAGRFSGGLNVPYGYYIQDKKYYIDPEESEVIKYVFQKASEGWGNIRIANSLNTRGIPSRHKKNNITVAYQHFTKSSENYIWTRSSVYNILKNELYIGKRTYKRFDNEHKQTYDFPELRIVTDDQFYSVRKRLEENKNKNFDFSKKYNYILDNKIIRCGVCGSAYAPVKDPKTSVYKCSTSKYSAGCKNCSVNIEKFEYEVQKELVLNFKELLLNTSKENGIVNELEMKNNFLKSEVENEQKTQEKLIQLFTRGIGNIDKLEVDINKIDEKIKKIEQEIKANLVKIQESKKMEKMLYRIEFELKSCEKSEALTRLSKEDIHTIVKCITITNLEMGSKNTNKKVSVTIELLNGATHNFETTQRK